jgi:hypothetical protein
MTTGGFIETVTRRQTADTGQKDESPAALAGGIDQEL